MYTSSTFILELRKASNDADENIFLAFYFYKNFSYFSDIFSSYTPDSELAALRSDSLYTYDLFLKRFAISYVNYKYTNGSRNRITAM